MRISFGISHTCKSRMHVVPVEIESECSKTVWEGFQGG